MNRLGLLLFPFLLACASSATTPSSISTPAVADRRCGSVRFPVQTTFDAVPLALNGMAIRDATIFHVDVYVGALYLESPTRDVETFLASSQRKRLILRFVRDVGRDDVVRAVRWGFRNNPEDVQARFVTEQNAIESLLTGYARGDEVKFDHRPGEGIAMRVNDVPRGAVGGDEFARAFWNVFVGPRRGNQAMREGLVGGVCND